MKGYAILLEILLLLLSSAAGAQDKQNFTGNWVLDTAKSDFGEFPVPDSQTNLIEHKDKTNADHQGRIYTRWRGFKRTPLTDGNESSNKVGRQELKSTANWDGKKLVIVTKLEISDGGKLEIRDSWELTDGGKQMAVTRAFKEPQGERSQRLLFNKQQ